MKTTYTSNVYAWMDRKGFQSQRLCVEPTSKMQTLLKSEDIKNLSRSQKRKINRVTAVVQQKHPEGWVRTYSVQTHSPCIFLCTVTATDMSWVCLPYRLPLTSYLCPDGQHRVTLGTTCVRFSNYFFNQLRRPELKLINMNTHRQCLSKLHINCKLRNHSMCAMKA